MVLAGLTLALFVALVGLTLGLSPQGQQLTKRVEAGSLSIPGSDRRASLAYRNFAVSSPAAQSRQFFLPIAANRGGLATVVTRGSGPQLRPALTSVSSQAGPTKPAPPVDPRQQTPILPAVAPPPPPRTPPPPPSQTGSEPAARALVAARPSDPRPLPNERQASTPPSGAGLAGHTEVPAAPTRAGPAAVGRFAEQFPLLSA